MAELSGWLRILVTSLILVSCVYADGLQQIQSGILDVVEPVISEENVRMQAIMKIYGQAVSWQQQIIMDRIRMEGDSGIMQVRNVFDHTKAWGTNTWSRGNGQAAIHNHANNIRTVGMGEFNAVLNGVPFTTRHNDYRLNKAHSTSKEYGATEPVDFPPVPSSVLEKVTVEEQIEEMREYFKAFAEQNKRHRDYEPYFKPVLAYMQGMWTVNTDTVEEPFFSDRHSIEADTWFQLQEDVMASLWGGKKDVNENLATLPTVIIGVNEDGSPRMAQWNYKILTHPISFDIPLNRFRPIDDLSVMVRNFKNLEDLAKTRSCRFQLNPLPKDEPYDGVWREEQSTGYVNYLEQLMKEVPGLDNYPADIKDDFFGAAPLQEPDDSSDELNTGYYHRYYSLSKRDASGFSKSARGFADANLFVAQNNQSKVAPIRLRQCYRRNCEYDEMRVSYAVPLEILYLTPLHSWNPYDIPFNAEDADFPAKGSDGRLTRDGRDAPDKAYNGASEKYYYLTPAELFESGELERDSADTTKDSVYVLDSDGVGRRTVASGMRIFLPEIPGVGNVRTRYPIFPVHQEGSAYYKEFSALKDVVRVGAKYAHLYDQPLGGLSTDTPAGSEVFTFAMRQAVGKGPHVHTFKLTGNQILALRKGAAYPGYTIQLESSTAASHSHTLVVWMKPHSSGVYIRTCDGRTSTCRDGHPFSTDCLDCPSRLLDP